MSKSYAALFTGGEPAAQAPPSPPAPEAARYRLLLIDDEPNVLSALRRVFRQENYEIFTASNGEAALAALKERPFHVVICDFMMPGMNGGEVLRQARTLQPDTIRMMLTGHADVGAVVAAVKAGAVYKFMLKPWNDDDLRVTVALALERHELVQKNRRLQQENAARAKELEALATLAVSNRSQIAIVLHKRNLLTTAQVQEIFRLQQQRKEPAIRIILDKGWVDEPTIHALLHKELLIEEVSLAEFNVDPGVAALVPGAMCRKQCIVPIRIEGRRMTLAMADPLDVGLLDDLQFAIGLDIQPALASTAAIQEKLDEIHGRQDKPEITDLNTVAMLTDPIEGIEVLLDEDVDDASLDDLLQGSDEPPAIRLVNAAILEAVRLGASDIHVQPRAKNVVVRYRIDGILQDKINIPHALHQAFVSRLKIMSELDISERRRPQDGRITVKTPTRVVDLRISTLPTINGEKIVMRLLDRNAPVLKLEALGFAGADLARIERAVAKPQGIILATGPTGSGKTTTLYSLLQHGITPTKNYVSIEDPVEYYMDQAGQVHVRERIGLTFPVVLRSILRQDPDVVLLGEIRDLETAEVAFHAALTGHQVFSTLHTNSAIASVARLLDLGLKPFVIATALEAIVAQRLVRMVCTECRREDEPDSRTLELLGFTGAGEHTLYKGAGCSRCHGTGYKGRVGLYEVLVPDEELRQLIASGSNALEMNQAVRRLGTRTLFDDALDKMRQGVTSAEEVLRVLGPRPTSRG
jgi:type II secretory ATPase GspE/PulE/Tfp pilus assembly ATPase PilB-like protein/DNA-binding response OmpR family regulator